MLKKLLGFFFRGRRSLLTVPLLLVAGFVAYEGLRFWWYYGYSRGTYEGTIRKVSFKGPPYCKYVSIEVITGGGGMMQPKVMEFTIDGRGEGTPLYQKFQDAERAQKSVVISYRQDLNKWWACAPTDHYALDVQ